MIARSKQHGVPVIASNDDVIVGFDQHRLEQLAQRVTRAGKRPRLGLIARDSSSGGVEVGGTRPGSPAELAGFQKGDFLESIDDKPIRSMTELEQALPNLPTGVPLDVTVRRGNEAERLHLTL